MAYEAAEPRRHRISVADFYRMDEIGLFAPDARVELIDGEIIDMAPPGPLHAGIVNHLTRLLVLAAGDHAVLLAQNPILLDGYSQPQPDFTLARPRGNFYQDGHPRPADVLLTVEVADSSWRFDRDVKVALYARHRIPEMWLIDVRGRKLVRYLNPERTTYTSIDQPDLAVPLAVTAEPNIRVDLARLFA